MDDYPDPADEFEMMYDYEEEMENMRMMELEAESENQPPTKSRRSLDFTSPPIPSSSKHIPDYAVASTSATPDQTLKTFSPVDPSTNLHCSGVRKESNGSATGSTSSAAIKLSLKERIDQAASDAETSKRKFNELFGDISDLQYDDDFDYPLKKPKSETDEELIKRILTRRKVNELSLKATRDTGNAQGLLDEQEQIKTSYITSRVPRWPFVTLKTKSGDRVYVRQRQEDYYNEAVDRVSAKTGRHVGLLSLPFATLRRQAELIIQKKLDDQEALKLDAARDIFIVESTGKENEDNSQLWVEKYKPHSYMDLLSDESTNRTLLHWLKLWDKVVFNREKKVRQKAKPFKAEKKKFAGNQINRFTKTVGGSAKGEEVDELDENGCPRLKMALLCGPPGLGKTTLAHLIAKHAGYNVVEVNASDERTPEAFRTALLAATQMRSVLGEKKPNCLVLDEIDGAPAASIEMLVKFATGKDVGKGRGKKKGRAAVLKRPIICICNDVYVPALRPLRMISFVVNFPPTLGTRLAQRLLEIARKQDIKTDLGVLLAMAEKSQNDIRSCVSLLHFLKNKGKGQAEVKMNDVLQASIGQRDVQKGLFTVWQEIFQIQRPKRGHSNNGKLEPMPDLEGPVAKFGDMSLSTRMRNVLHTVQSCGDYDRLGQGVFENYPLLNIKDSSMEGIVDSLEWFCVSDVLNRSIYGEQNYFLMAYLPFAFVAHHFNFASLAWPKLHYPSAGYENSVKETRNKSTLKEVLHGMTPKVRTFTNGQQLILDTLPILLDVLVPQLRPVSTQLYSLREKEELKQVISIMIDFNLNYIQERTPEGAYEYHLEPNIEELCQFASQESRAPRSLTYSGKQLLSQEIELEKMRRSEAGRQLGQISAAIANDAPTPDEPAAVPSYLQTLVPKPVVPQTDPGMMKDFFGRVVPCSQIVGNTTKTDEIVKSDIWFHFKEGFSNAVRKSVKIKDLL